MNGSVKEWVSTGYTPPAPVADLDLLAVVANAAKDYLITPEPELDPLPATWESAITLLATRCVDGWNATTARDVRWLREVLTIAEFSVLAGMLNPQETERVPINLRQMILNLLPTLRFGQVVWL
jgi:hypothetical protein